MLCLLWMALIISINRITTRNVALVNCMSMVNKIMPQAWMCKQDKRKGHTVVISFISPEEGRNWGRIWNYLFIQWKQQILYAVKVQLWMKEDSWGQASLRISWASYLPLCSTRNYYTSTLDAQGFSLNPSVLIKETLAERWQNSSVQ